MVDKIRAGRVPAYAAYGGVPEAEAYGSVSNIGHRNTVPSYQGFGVTEPEQLKYHAYPEPEPEPESEPEGPNPFRGVFSEALKGITQGAIGGIESFINGIGGGLYETLDDSFGLGFRNRRQELQDLAEGVSPTLGQMNKLANKVTEVSGALMPLAAAKTEDDALKILMPSMAAQGFKTYDNLKNWQPNGAVYYLQNNNQSQNDNYNEDNKEEHEPLTLYIRY